MRSKFSIHLKYDTAPYYCHAYQAPQAYELTLKKKVDSLVKIGVLQNINHSQWAAPTFLVSKQEKQLNLSVTLEQ